MRPRGGATPGERRVLLARRDRSVASPWPPLRRTLLRLLADHDAAGTLSVALVDDEEMRRIHRDFSGIDEPTDVLSFPLAGAGGVRDGILGEVIVSAETARREARRRGLSPAREVALYAIHGALHLVGCDDKDAGRRRAMRRKEREYLAVWSAEARGRA
jgi:probable rRNA maturation factor